MDINILFVRSVARLALFLGLVLPCATNAEVTVLPQREPQRVFSGEPCVITLQVQNAGDSIASDDFHFTLSQASSGSIAPVDTRPWKRIQVLPHQIVTETVSVSFPTVRAETTFVIQWATESRKSVGITRVLAYPRDLLKELKTLGGGEPVGVLDPNDQLKPALKMLTVEFVDLEDSGFENFSGKLAILGPFKSKRQESQELASRTRDLASKGAAIVWIQPPATPRAQPKPSYYTISEGKGAVVIVQSTLLPDLARDPQSQINLLEIARLAVKPELLQLPH